jgi:hypothetical protein
MTRTRHYIGENLRKGGSDCNNHSQGIVSFEPKSKNQEKEKIT